MAIQKNLDKQKIVVKLSPAFGKFRKVRKKKIKYQKSKGTDND